MRATLESPNTGAPWQRCSAETLCASSYAYRHRTWSSRQGLGGSISGKRVSAGYCTLL